MLISGADTSKYAWFIETKYNALFQLDKVDGKIRSVTSFEGKEGQEEYLYSHVLAVDNRIVLIPFLADCLTLYDFQMDSAVYYDISEIYPLNKTKFQWRVSGFYYFGGRLYLFPVECERGVYSIELDSGDCRKEDDLSTFYANNIPPGRSYIGNTVAGIGENIYINNDSLDVFKYDLNKNEGTSYKVTAKGVLCPCMSVIDEKLWFFLRGTEGIGLLDTKTGQSSITDSYPQGIEVCNNSVQQGQSYNGALALAEKVFFVPARSNMGVATDEEGNTIEGVFTISNMYKERIAYSFSFKLSNSIVLLPYDGYEAIVITVDDDKMQAQPYDYNFKSAEIRYKLLKGVITEDEKYGLKDYIKTVCGM